MRAVAAAVTCSIMLGGCVAGGADEQTRSAYEPVADERLFSDIRKLAGVTSVDIVFNDTWPENGYVGEVDIAAGAAAADVLDHVYAILRQGRPDATIGIMGYQGNRQVDLERAGSGTLPELELRYGPQPGDGTPPDD